MHHKDKGNALFLILIAVALFGALSYAITQSGRGSGDINREQGVIAAARMVEYGGLLAHATQRLLLTNGCSDSTLNYYGITRTSFSNNTTAPASGACDIFKPAGAGLTALSFPLDNFTVPTSANWTTNLSSFPVGYPALNINNQVTGLGTSAVAPASTGVDLLLQFFPLRLDICTEINRKLNVNAPTFAPIIASLYVGISYVGVYTNSSTFTGYPADKVGACFYNGTYDMYIYVQPLLDR